MKEVQINFIVKDSKKALELYETIFDVKRIEVGDFVVGQNSIVMKIYNSVFHISDENTSLGMAAPDEESEFPIWFDVTVPNIDTVFKKAMESGCKTIQEITNIPEMGIKNALFKDPYGYIWVLHQVYEKVDYETRAKFLEDQGFERVESEKM